MSHFTQGECPLCRYALEGQLMAELRQPIKWQTKEAAKQKDKWGQVGRVESQEGVIV